MVRKKIPTQIGAETKALEAEFDVQELNAERAPQHLTGRFIVKDWADELYLYQSDPHREMAPALKRIMWPFNTRQPAYCFAVSNQGKREFQAWQANTA